MTSAFPAVQSGREKGINGRSEKAEGGAASNQWPYPYLCFKKPAAQTTFERVRFLLLLNQFFRHYRLQQCEAGS